MWLKARLRAAGVRSISNVVDVTNYVMLVFGSPLHVFDYETLTGGAVIVRRARPGEELRTLDGNLRKLDPADLVIADADRAVALAGIMGGERDGGDRADDVRYCSRPRTSSRSGSSRARNGTRCAPRARTGGRRASTRTSPARPPRLRRSCSSSSPARAGRATSTCKARCRSGSRSGCAPGALMRCSGSTFLRRNRRRSSTGSGSTATCRAGSSCRRGAHGTSRARSTSSRRLRASKLTEIPFTLPRRDAMFGRLSRWQRIRRLAEDVLAGCGLLGGVHAVVSPPTETSACPSRSRPRRPRSARRLPGVSSRLRGTTSRSATPTSRCSRSPGFIRAVTVSCRTSVGTSQASSTVDSRTRVGGPAGLRRAQARTDVRAHIGIVLASRQGCSHRRRLGRRAASVPARGSWGAFELDLDALAARAPEAGEFDEVSPFPEVRQDLAFVVGDDVRQPQWRRRSATRAGRSCVTSRCSTSTAARRSDPASARSRSASRSDRPSGR